MQENNRCNGCMAPRGEHEYCPDCGFKDDQMNVDPLYIMPGTLLNGYQFGRVLGHGGFGITYLAYDFNNERKVAIKEFLPADLATRRSDSSELSIFTGEKENTFRIQIEKFKDEVVMLKGFKGFPGIVEAYDLFEANHTAYFVMEYVEGITLKEYADQKGGRLPFEKVRVILLPVMDALDEMHRKNIIHRDISPDNIYITMDKRVKLLDFGAARLAVNNPEKGLSVILKHGFTPKEQYFTKGNQGPWTDIYALGATAYYLMTGNVPEAALDRLELDRLVPLTSYISDLSENVNRVICKALSVEEINRYQSIKDFKIALLTTDDGATMSQQMNQSVQSAMQTAKQSAAQPQPTQKKTSRFVTAVAIGVILFSILGIGITYIVMPKIPDLTGETEEDAIEILKDLGYRKSEYEISYENDDRSDLGEVLEQSPEAGKKSFKKYVELTVSEGPEAFELSNVVGKTEEEAVKILEKVGLNVRVNTEFSEEPIGIIVSTAPETGETVKAKDEIIIFTSAGPDPSIIVFTDPAFKQAIISELELDIDPKTGVVTKEMVKYVRDLYLSYADITSIDGIEAFESLESLSVSNNLLELLPQLPPKLSYLEVSDNLITQIDVSYLEELYSLYADNNLLVELPKVSESVGSIYVNSNMIEDISGISELTNLVSLDLSFNKIKDFSVLNDIYERFYTLETEGNEGTFSLSGDYVDSDWAASIASTNEENTSIIASYPSENENYELLLDYNSKDFEGVSEFYDYGPFTTVDGVFDLYNYNVDDTKLDYFMDQANGKCRYFDIYGEAFSYFDDGKIVCGESRYNDVIDALGNPAAVYDFEDEVRLDYITADAVFAFFFEREGTVSYLRIINLEHYYGEWE